MCGPLFLPICVSQNRSPFLGGEGREVALGPVLDFIEEQKVVVIIDALVRGLTTPEQVDRRKREAARRPTGSEIEMADVIYGLSPDSCILGNQSGTAPASARRLSSRLFVWVSREAVSVLALLARRPATHGSLVRIMEDVEWARLHRSSCSPFFPACVSPPSSD